MRAIVVSVLACGLAGAQVQTQVSTPPQSGSVPVYRVTVVGRTTKAVNYRHRGGATKVDFRGTALLPESRGQAKVESKQGYIEIEVEFRKLQPATKYGPEYLTYVMWAITPEGRATNLGEVLLNGENSKLNVTTELQAFGLIVTAEPYFGVTQPSDVVVMENEIRSDTLGKVEVVDAKYDLLQRGQYTMYADPQVVKAVPLTGMPIEVAEARNAVQIARWSGADKYATDSFGKAEKLLAQAEDYNKRKQKKPAAMIARESVQAAEDARLITVKRREEERLAQERAAAEAKIAQAKTETEQEAARRAAAEAESKRSEAERQRAEAERAAADRARQQADEAARMAQQQRAAAEAAQQQAQAAQAQAEAARQAALAEQQRLAAEADKAKQAAAQAEADRLKLRQQIQAQLNQVLETRDSARGLIVNMSDVLFDFNKFTLRPAAREKLAKVSGIVLAHPGLKLEVEGHTDSIGSDDYNQKLSENRASAVRDYLLQQGLHQDIITSRGFGKTRPVADNSTAAGRQQNRRVELVVSGEPIGTQPDVTSQTQPSSTAPKIGQ